MYDFLTAKDKQELIACAHDLKPVVWVGQKGLTENVLDEISHALDDHELIKIKISHSDDKKEREELSKKIASELDALFLKLIGNIAIFYRCAEELE